MIGRFLRDETGATAMEYALIGSLISLTIIGGAIMIADEVGALFVRVATEGFQ